MDNKIIQLSIFVNNEPGSLSKMAKMVSDLGIELRAFNLAESAGFGVFRAIVKDPIDASKKLKERNIIVKTTELVAITVGGDGSSQDMIPWLQLYDVTKTLSDEGISIEYGYAHPINGKLTVFLRVSDVDTAISSFGKKKYAMLSMKDL